MSLSQRRRRQDTGLAAPVEPVEFYWRPGCPFCRALERELTRAGVPMIKINIWEDPAAAARVRAVANGNETVPTVFVNGRGLVNPSVRKVVTAAAEDQPGKNPIHRQRAPQKQGREPLEQSEREQHQREQDMEGSMSDTTSASAPWAAPRIPVHRLDDAPEAARGQLLAISRHLGTTLNIHAEMAHAPVVLAGYAGLQAAIGEHGTFPATVREAIALALGAVDDCTYCQSAHTVSGRAASLTDEQMLAIRRGESSGDDKLDALLAIARQAARQVGDIFDDVWLAALDSGWSVTELAELFTHIAANLYTNYFNHYARTQLDVPPAPGI